MAQKYTDPAAFEIVVVGDLSKIGESLKSLDRPVLYYDTQGNPLEAKVKKTQANAPTEKASHLQFRHKEIGRKATRGYLSPLRFWALFRP